MSKSGKLFSVKHFRRKIYPCIAVSFLLCLAGCGKVQEEETAVPPVVIRTFPVPDTTRPKRIESEELPTESETSPPTWQATYQTFLEQVREEQPDLKFTLLYMDDDDIPELCFYQSSCVDVYSYKDDTMSYAFRFQTDYYSYGFSYRPRQCMVATQQGSVMNYGTYLEIETFERTEEGFVHSGKYDFSDMPYTIQILKEQGSYTEDEEVIGGLDLQGDNHCSLGESWVDYSTNSKRSDFAMYEMTDENIAMLLQEE